MSLLPTDPKERKYLLLGLRIIGDFGAVIAVPVIVFVLIGQWLDKRYGNNVLFTVIGFIIAALLSAKMIYKKAKEYGKEYQALNSEGKKEEIKK